MISSLNSFQASNKTKGSVERLGLSFYLLFVGERSLLESHWLTFGWAFLRLYTANTTSSLSAALGL